MKRLIFLLLNFISIVTLGHAAERTNRYPECVGRLTLNFPFEVEVAGASYDELKKQISEPNFNPQYVFSDGEIPWSSRIFYQGPILISNDMSPQQVFFAKNFFIEKRKKYINFLKESNITETKVGGVTEVSKNTIAWTAENSVRTFTNFDNNLIIYSFSKNEKLSKNITLVEDFSKDVRYRRLSEVPSDSGLCLPHAFIRTSNFEGRGIRATYKLIKHPDVTVWISESSSIIEPDKIREENKSPKNVINSFWTQYGTKKGIKNIEPILHGRNGESINLAGRKGIASFVKINRDSGIEDYGYYASARGEPGNEDAPDINIYVIRNSLFSGPEGAVSQEEFMRIVETLQTSLMIKPK